MKGFKGTDKNGKCRGFQYEENHDYEFESAELCHSGGHFCTEPLDVFKYYPPGSKSRYFTVEAIDEDVSSETDGVDSKRVTSKLHIGKELSIKGLIEAHINFVNENIHEHINCGNFEVATGSCKDAVAAGYSGIAMAGDWSAATAGEHGTAVAGHKGVAKVIGAGIASVGNAGVALAGYKSIATAGNSGAAITGAYGITTTGYYGVAMTGNAGIATAGNSGAATAGDSGIVTVGDDGAATTGNYGMATAGRSSSIIAGRNGMATAGSFSTVKVGNFGMAMAGNYGTAIAGDRSVATTSECGTAIAGNWGIATSRGSSSVGENGSALARGINVKIRGELGAILVLVEEDKCSRGDIKDWRAFVVDGENYKPNTWYQLKDGEVVEVQEEDEQKNYRGLRSE